MISWFKGYRLRSGWSSYGTWNVKNGFLCKLRILFQAVLRGTSVAWSILCGTKACRHPTKLERSVSQSSRKLSNESALVAWKSLTLLSKRWDKVTFVPLSESYFFWNTTLPFASGKFYCSWYLWMQHQMLDSLRLTRVSETVFEL